MQPNDTGIPQIAAAMRHEALEIEQFLDEIKHLFSLVVKEACKQQSSFLSCLGSTSTLIILIYQI